MNTVFNVLWFEDEIAWYRMEKLRVESIIKEHYLTPQIIRKDGMDFDIDMLTGNDYDLILMDYKLAQGITGDGIATTIRGNDILTDILFYSSEEKSMLNAIASGMPPLDGVYLTKRDYTIFTEKVRKLIDKIVKRSEDIVNLRGFVLDGSSDFEVRVKEILNIAWSKFQQCEKEVLEEAVNKTIEKNEERYNNLVKKVITESPVFPVANNEKYFFSHSDRLYLLTKVINILVSNYGFVPEEEMNAFKVNYEKDISHYRNAFGHKKATDSVIEITKGTFVDVDETLHRKMRQNITRYDQLITILEKFVAENI